MIKATLCFVLEGDPGQRILLGHKKRGFAQGKVDGFGGKLQPGEDVLAAAVRELEEETGLCASPEDMVSMGIITFFFPNQPAWDHEVHIFLTRQWQGFPSETEEMLPKWYALDEIPYPLMWDDSRYWLPQVLAGIRLQAIFTYDDNNEKVKGYTIQAL